MVKLKTLLALSVFALSCVMASAAAATTITQTKTTGYSEPDLRSRMSFQKFDPTLGSLSSIDMTFTGTLSADMFSLDGGTHDYIWNGRIDIYDPIGFSVLFENSTGTVSGYGYKTDDTDYITKTIINTYSDPLILAQFIGTNPIDIYGNGFIYLFDRRDVGVYGSYKYSLSLSYNYSEPAPVPEPSTMLLFGAGLAGFALWRRKKTV